VPESAITSLPRIHLDRLIPSPVSGATQWTRGRWVIIVNGADPKGRQRYSMAHELKHIIDAPFAHFLYPERGSQSSHERAEQTCDFFAAALLMPRSWVKRLFCDELTQDVRNLSRHFEVSTTAMQVRLLQLGLIDPPVRCGFPAIGRRVAEEDERTYVAA
jgi:Zn-dependent peptidase ImmA (M78 family)